MSQHANTVNNMQMKCQCRCTHGQSLRIKEKNKRPRKGRNTPGCPQVKANKNQTANSVYDQHNNKHAKRRDDTHNKPGKKKERNVITYTQSVMTSLPTFLQNKRDYAIETKYTKKKRHETTIKDSHTMFQHMNK